jgi:hypothetical protein
MIRQSSRHSGLDGSLVSMYAQPEAVQEPE